MTPEIFARYDRALATVGADLYLSGASADVHHLSGSEDGNALVIYAPGHRPVVVVRTSGVACVAASARASEVVPVALDDDPGSVLAAQVWRLRPRRMAAGPLDDHLRAALTTHLPDVAVSPTPRLGWELRRVKDPEEVTLLEAAAACVEAGVRAAFETIRVGVSDREVAAAADAAARRQGADTVVFLQVKAGPRSAYPDAEEVGRRFEPNEIGFLDLGIRHRHYLGDYTRAFVLGDPPAEARRIVEVVDRVQREILTMLRPEMRCAELYHAARQLFATEGYLDAIPHHLGHGIGLGDDFLPRIVPTSDDVFLDGEVVCVEPGVYLPGLGGVRIEDTVLIRAEGNEILSRAPRVGRA